MNISNMHNYVLIGIVVIVLLYIMCVQQKVHIKENMQEIYYPRTYQPKLASQVEYNNLIQLNEMAQYPWEENIGKYNKYGEFDNILNDGANGNLGLNFNLCSKSCCAEQYPLPFPIKPDDLVVKSGKEYVASNITCNDGWNDSGCACMTPEQSLHLSRRGNNAYTQV